MYLGSVCIDWARTLKYFGIYYFVSVKAIGFDVEPIKMSFYVIIEHLIIHPILLRQFS